MNWNDVHNARQYAALGYPQAIQADTLQEIQAGDSVIVITKKGEPVMLGEVDEVTETSLSINGCVYNEADYYFRRA